MLMLLRPCLVCVPITQVLCSLESTGDWDTVDQQLCLGLLVLFENLLSWQQQHKGEESAGSMVQIHEPQRLSWRRGSGTVHSDEEEGKEEGPWMQGSMESLMQKMMKEVQTLKATVEEVKAENVSLKATVEEVKAENVSLKATVEEVEAKSVSLEARVKELESVELKKQLVDLVTIGGSFFTFARTSVE